MGLDYDMLMVHPAEVIGRAVRHVLARAIRDASWSGPPPPDLPAPLDSLPAEGECRRVNVGHYWLLIPDAVYQRSVEQDGEAERPWREVSGVRYVGGWWGHLSLRFGRRWAVTRFMSESSGMSRVLQTPGVQDEFRLLLADTGGVELVLYVEDPVYWVVTNPDRVRRVRLDEWFYPGPQHARLDDQVDLLLARLSEDEK